MWSEHDRPPVKTDIYLLLRLRPLNVSLFVGVGIEVTLIVE